MRWHRVFVYGTLRRGGCNHGLVAQERLLGEHVTEPAYTMLDVGPYPGVITRGETAIRGEVYEVTPLTFQRLDELEDYPRNYTRQLIDTPWGEAWMYIYRPRGKRLPEVALGDWFQRRAVAGDGGRGS